MAQLALDRSFRIAQHRSSYPADWYIEDHESMPHSSRHDDHEDRLKSTLRAWKARTGRDLLVSCELAFRWDQKHPRVGIDPDVFIVEMPPLDEDGDIHSIRTWEQGHLPPLLAIEIVSRSRPQKDYTRAPERHELLGTYELFVFDPDLHGHSKEQPSVRLQMFQRETNNHLVQTYAGEGPVYSEVLGAWITVVKDELVISNDRAGTDRWLSLEEEASLRADDATKRADDATKRADDATKRADDATKRADDATKRAENDRADKEKALARIAELEAMLAHRR